MSLERSGEDLAAVVAQARDGDRASRARIYDQFASSVQRCVCALRLGLQHTEVEDAVQETFLRLFDGLERYDPQRPLRPYVLGIARRVALETGRRRARAQGGQEALSREPSRETPAPERSERAEQRQEVRSALAALGEEHHAALALRHTQRLTMQELAESLSCSVPTARARLREAARRFAAELRQRGVIAPGEEVA